MDHGSSLLLFQVGVSSLDSWLVNQPLPNLPRNEALLRAYQPLVSLRKVFLIPYFWGGIRQGDRLSSHNFWRSRLREVCKDWAWRISYLLWFCSLSRCEIHYFWKYNIDDTGPYALCIVLYGPFFLMNIYIIYMYWCIELNRFRCRAIYSWLYVACIQDNHCSRVIELFQIFSLEVASPEN